MILKMSNKNYLEKQKFEHIRTKERERFSMNEHLNLLSSLRETRKDLKTSQNKLILIFYLKMCTTKCRASINMLVFFKALRFKLKTI